MPPLLLNSILKNKPSHMLLMVCAPPAKVDAAANMGVPVIASTLPVGLGMSSKLATICIHDYVKVVRTNIIIALHIATMYKPDQQCNASLQMAIVAQSSTVLQCTLQQHNRKSISNHFGGSNIMG